MTTNTGGTAFPCHTIAMHEGMTLRDYFAAKALQGLVTHAHILEWSEEAIADAAYRQAEAMLKAREA